MEAEAGEKMSFGGVGSKLKGDFKDMEDKHRAIYETLADSDKKLQYFSARQIVCRLLGSRGYLCQKTRMQNTTKLKKIIQDSKELVMESDIFSRMQALKDQLIEAINHVHKVSEVHVFVAICRGFWDRMGQEEVELDRKVVNRKGRLTAVTTEVRKESGELVAIGRQWMTASRPKGSQGSKL